MINSGKLRGKIIENGLTIQKLAVKMSLTPYTLGRKLAGKNPITLDEANLLQKFLSISDEEFRDYFFIS